MGDIIELQFKGTHQDGNGHELRAFAFDTLLANRAAAVILEFLGFEYLFGNDIGGIACAFVFPDEQMGAARVHPCAIVATGRTERGLRESLEWSGYTKQLDVSFFSSSEEALAHLRMKLEG